MRSQVLVVLLLIAAAVPALAQLPVEPPQDPNAAGNFAGPFAKTDANKPSLLGARDFLAPVSTVHWGPWSLYSVQLTSIYSNLPFNGGQDQFSATPSHGLNQGATMMLNGTASLGTSIRTGTGFMSFHYQPTFEHQSVYAFTQVNHHMNLALDREFGGRAWRLSVGVDGGTYNRFSSFFNQGRLGSLVQQQSNLSNLDLQNVLSEPQSLQPVTQDLVVSANRYFQGQASFTLTRRLSARDNLSLTGGYYMHRIMDRGEAGQNGQLLQDINTNGRSLGLSYSHTISPRQHVGLSIHNQENEGSRSRSLMMNYSWLPAPRWTVNLGAGPALMSDGLLPTRLSTAVHASVGRIIQSSVVQFMYARAFYSGGLPGAQQGDSVTLEWAPRPHGHHWRYAVSGGYQWLSSLSGRQVVSGWSIRPTFMLPVTRTLMVQTSYAFFHQAQGMDQRLLTGSPALLAYQRSMVTVGLVWSFNRSADRQLER